MKRRHGLSVEGMQQEASSGCSIGKRREKGPGKRGNGTARPGAGQGGLSRTGQIKCASSRRDAVPCGLFSLGASKRIQGTT
ncbi:unnamed protein product [Prunus armeniaca]|uniref:Uncharacterized protein n=1 Tax=Prunus armeniaca TaxID=36596 RepID=A0A6J5VMM7_PRUAR|nr:unnamed protein product [Prunus armeniaca]